MRVEKSLTTAIASSNKASCQLDDVEEFQQVEKLIVLFNQLFAASHNTILVRGGNEPIYLPADSHNAHHRIMFAHGYFASALHEISHWCIAGAARRQLEDFGYWYNPDGRTPEQQKAFQQVEVRPQALEWLLTVASGRKFRISFDNLTAEDNDPKEEEQFKDKVQRMAISMFAKVNPLLSTDVSMLRKSATPLPISRRAIILIDALLKAFESQETWCIDAFSRSNLDL